MYPVDQMNRLLGSPRLKPTSERLHHISDRLLRGSCEMSFLGATQRLVLMRDGRRCMHLGQDKFSGKVRLSLY